MKRWVAMGGRYPEAAVVAVRHWPRPLVFSGVGGSIMTGASLAETSAENPVRRAYELYLGDLEEERPSWDQAALLYAVRGAAPFWEEITQGYNRLFDDGRNRWRRRPDDRLQTRIALGTAPSKPAAVIEQLMSQPPPR